MKEKADFVDKLKKNKMISSIGEVFEWN